MELRSSIEIKLISGADLRAFNFFQKLSIFVIASMAADDPTQKIQNNQLQRTQTDREGDGNPEWNHEIKFLIGEDLESDSDHLFIHLDLRHDGVLFGIGDRSIGEVRIPLKDLTDEASSNGVVRFVRYQVKSSDGKPNGVLNLSYKYNSKCCSNKIQYPKVEEIPNLDLQVSSLSFSRQTYWSSSSSSSSFSVAERQGNDWWSFRPGTVSYPQIDVPQPGSGSGGDRHYYHGRGV